MSHSAQVKYRCRCICSVRYVIQKRLVVVVVVAGKVPMPLYMQCAVCNTERVCCQGVSTHTQHTFVVVLLVDARDEMHDPAQQKDPTIIPGNAIRTHTVVSMNTQTTTASKGRERKRRTSCTTGMSCYCCASTQI